MVEDNLRKLVTFRLGKEFYGIDIMLVNSIVDYDDIRPVPNAPNYIAGIYNLRGEIIPVINLHERFDIENIDYSGDASIINALIIVELNGSKIAFIVDYVHKVLSIDVNNIQPSPATISSIRTEYIQGVYDIEESQLLIILNVLKIFSANELKSLKFLNK